MELVMSVQVLGKDGASLQDIVAAGTKTANYTVSILTDGNPEKQAYLGEYYLAVNIPQFTAALAANTAIFSVRNGTTRKMKFITLEVSPMFAGTAAASTMQVSVRRFTTATPTAGTAGVIVLEDTTSSATAIADSRYATAAAGLTTTGVVTSAPIFAAATPRSITGTVFNYQMDRDIVLQPNEGLLIQYDTVGVIGDAVSITAYWGEY
jgi:hypothetical protein